jgi:hypothetical protein
VKTLADIEQDLLHELGERETLTRNTFHELRSTGKSQTKLDDMTNALTEIRCLRRTLETLRKGG